MTKKLLYSVIISGNMLLINLAHANYFIAASINTAGYKLNQSSIPATVGEETSWWMDSGSVLTNISSSNTNSYAQLTINGTLVGDNIYATNNPGLGIKYRLYLGTDQTTPPAGSEIAPDYKVTLNATPKQLNTYTHVYYKMVRLTEKVEAGKITSAPDVILTFHNPNGDGPSTISGTILSGISSQPQVVGCTVDAVSEIKLPTLYGNELINGAQKITEAPTIMLKNCPGAINSISYNFSAVYGTHNSTNGVLKTVTGDGYAKNVYVQIQNADGSAHIVNGSIPLSNYDGSGDYAIPDFKVAYFIDDANTVTAGKVKTAIELKVTYN